MSKTWSVHSSQLCTCGSENTMCYAFFYGKESWWTKHAMYSDSLKFVLIFPRSTLSFLSDEWCLSLNMHRTWIVGTALSREKSTVWCSRVWWQLLIPSHGCGLLIFDNDNSSAGNSTKYYTVITLLSSWELKSLDKNFLCILKNHKYMLPFILCL